MEFIPSKDMKIYLNKEQQKQLSSSERINYALCTDEAFAFDVVENDEIIGFVMLSCFAPCSYFLWNFAIDVRYQQQGYGQKTLDKLFVLLKKQYNASVITTTYCLKNITAKHLYEKIGFIETDRIEKGNIKEVNMVYFL